MRGRGRCGRACRCATAWRCAGCRWAGGNDLAGVLVALAPEQALGLQFARAAPVKGAPAVRLTGVAEAGVAQRRAPQLAVPAGERRGELTVARVPRDGRDERDERDSCLSRGRAGCAGPILFLFQSERARGKQPS